MSIPNFLRQITDNSLGKANLLSSLYFAIVDLKLVGVPIHWFCTRIDVSLNSNTINQSIIGSDPIQTLIQYFVGLAGMYLRKASLPMNLIITASMLTF